MGSAVVVFLSGSAGRRPAASHETTALIVGANMFCGYILKDSVHCIHRLHSNQPAGLCVR